MSHDGQFDRVVELLADTCLDLGTQPVDPTLVDEVLEPCLLAVLPIAEVALGGDNRLHDVDEVVGRDPHSGEPRRGIGVVAGGAAAEAATGEYDESGQLAEVPSERVGTMPTSLL